MFSLLLREKKGSKNLLLGAVSHARYARRCITKN